MEPLTEYALIAGGTIVAVIIGFIMGFKAARPEEKLAERKFDPGPTDEPDEDIWRDAMTAPDKEEKRIPTI